MGAPGPCFRNRETTTLTPPSWSLFPRPYSLPFVKPSHSLPPATPSFHAQFSAPHFADHFPHLPHNRTVNEEPLPSTRHKSADSLTCWLADLLPHPVEAPPLPPYIFLTRTKNTKGCAFRAARNLLKTGNRLLAAVRSAKHPAPPLPQGWRHRTRKIDLPIPRHQQLNRQHLAVIALARLTAMRIFVGQIFNRVAQHLQRPPSLAVNPPTPLCAHRICRIFRPRIRNRKSRWIRQHWFRPLPAPILPRKLVCPRRNRQR